MPDRVFSFEETPASRSETTTPPSYTLQYRAIGEFDDLTVQHVALALTPPFVTRPTGNLFRQDVQREPDGWGNYLVTVPYGKLERETGTFNFTFDTTGGTINIKAAKQHIASYPDNGDWHKGAIGVKSDGDVSGADIVIPALRLNYNFRHPAGVVTEAFAKTIASATGATNLLPFRTFQPEELLFIGGTGADGSDSEAEIGYQFVASGDATLTIGDIAGIAKKGHHLLWIEFKDEVEAGQAVRQPKRVHIERVYDPIDFAAVFGWS